MKYSLLVFLFILTFPAILFSQSQPTPVVTVYDDYGYYKKNGQSSKHWNELIKEGFASYDKKDCDKTIAYLKQAVAAGSSDPIALFKLGACAELTGSPYSALQYYRQAEDALKTLKSPHRYGSDIYEAIGRTLYLNKKYAEALPYLVKASEVGTPHFALFYLLGSLYLDQKNSLLAIHAFEQALKYSADAASPAQLVQVYGMLGKAALENKEPDKAVGYFDQALKIDPNNQDIARAKHQATELKRQNQLFEVMQQIMDGKPTSRPGL